MHSHITASSCQVIQMKLYDEIDGGMRRYAVESQITQIFCLFFNSLPISFASFCPVLMNTEQPSVPEIKLSSSTGTLGENVEDGR